MAKPAQPKPHSRIHVNLIYSQGIPQKLPLRFLAWLIAYGRFIVIFVEILVVASFLARFKFDADLADLKEKINAQVPYLETLVSDEEVVRHTQNRLSVIQQNNTNTPNWLEVYSIIANQVPRGVKLTNINLKSLPQSKKVELRINAQANSNNEMGIFFNGLRKNTKINDINLASISYDQDTITFTITGSI